MKKLFYTIPMFLFCLVQSAQAQQFYIKAGIGYSIPAMSETFLTESTETHPYSINSSNYDRKTSPVEGSYAAGLLYGAAAGYHISSTLGIEINFSFLNGKEYEGNSIFLIDEDDTYRATIRETIKGKGLYIAPSLVYTFPTDNKLRPYVMGGPVFGKVTDLVGTYTFTPDTSSYDTPVSIKTKTTCHSALGASLGVGLQYALTDKISLYGEAVFNTLNFYFEKTTLTEYVVDGEDVADQMSTYWTTTVYTESTSIHNDSDYGEEIDQDEPYEEIRTKHSFSNIALRVGLAYQF